MPDNSVAHNPTAWVAQTLKNKLLYKSRYLVVDYAQWLEIQEWCAAMLPQDHYRLERFTASPTLSDMGFRAYFREQEQLTMFLLTWSL